MSFENYFPLWNDLNTVQKKVISDNLITRDVKKGTIIHNGNLDCTGLLLVKSGQLRTYILSDEGREITLYRLFDMDMCLLSASCIMQSIQFEVTIEAEKDTDLWILVPTGKLSLECFDTFKAKVSSNSHAAKSPSLIRKNWKHYKDHKPVFL